MYNLDFQCDNIFRHNFPYKIHCIGKCEKQTGMFACEGIYYFISHGERYEVQESVKGLEDITVILRKVEDFTLPNDPAMNYAIFKREVSHGVKYDMIKRYEGMTYSKDGFVIFKQMYAQSDCAALGGIADVYEYEHTNYAGLRRKLDTMEYDKETD